MSCDGLLSCAEGIWPEIPPFPVSSSAELMQQSMALMQQSRELQELALDCIRRAEAVHLREQMVDWYGEEVSVPELQEDDVHFWSKELVPNVDGIGVRSFIPPMVDWEVWSMLAGWIETHRTTSNAEGLACNEAVQLHTLYEPVWMSKLDHPILRMDGDAIDWRIWSMLGGVAAHSCAQAGYCPGPPGKKLRWADLDVPADDLLWQAGQKKFPKGKMSWAQFLPGSWPEGQLGVPGKRFQEQRTAQARWQREGRFGLSQP